jgi:hypothetical protein
MGNVNCSQICGPGEREGLALDRNEIDATPMQPARIVADEDSPKKDYKKSTPTPNPTPKVNIELFAKKIISIDKRFSHIKYRKAMKRWRAAAASVKPVIVHDSSADDGLKRLGTFVTEEEMRRQTKEVVLVLEKQQGPLAEMDSKNMQGKGQFTKGPFRYNSDRSIYKGSWNQELRRHGYGTLVKEDGSKYEGNWDNDEQSGYGRYFDNKGNYFVGKVYIFNR